jgi:hypothetical protein
MLCNLHKNESHKKHLHVLHKHEEGFHNGAADKEGKASANPDSEDNRTDDCNMCADLDAEENADGTAGMHECDMCNDYNAKNGTSEGMHDCPACKEYDASQQNTGGIETDDCPYCQEDNALNNSNPDGCEMCAEYNAAQGTKDLENISGAQDHPEAEQDHICNCPDCVANKKDETDLGVEDMAAQRPDNCPECQKMYGDAVENEPGQTGQEDPNLQGHETAEEVLDMLDQEPGAGGQTPAEAAKKIDNTELPQGDQMKDNVSVKENFGDKQKKDISDSEMDAQAGQKCDCPSCPKGGDHSQDADPAMAAADPAAEDPNDQPDMTGVLQSGLDEHADAQKKQQVLDMVGQTLAGFKANKAQLEATKEQNQALYNSCIQMLKSMISLCDLLGLKPKPMDAPGPNDEGASESAEGNAPAPQPPQGPPSEGSPAPKAQGQE